MSTSYQTINPATGQALETYSYTSEETVAQILADAATRQKTWRATSVPERSKTLRRIGALILQHKADLARQATLEMGKPLKQSVAELEKCARTFDYYADHAAEFLADKLVATEASKSYVSYQPLGVVLAVMPWNFPYWQVFRALAPILAGGNVMVLKHASNVSGCALKMATLFQNEPDLQHLLQVVLLPGSAVEPLIAAPEIAAVTFTGSTAVGRKIASAAGQHLKKHVLELGGSDPYVILNDADIAQAVKVCAESRLNNGGQSCVSAKRFIVVPDVLQAFTDGLVAAFRNRTFSDPLSEASILGPMARTDLRDELHEQVQKSIAAGARLLLGGTLPEQDGAWYPPTILANVRPGMPAYEEELFGPVAAIIPAQNEADALRIANDTVYGLGGAIFSTDTARAEQLAREVLQSGNCFVNDAVHSDPRLPFGGVKDSGYGRELSETGIHEFVNIKTVYVQ
ncbi:MAG: NAD-dependent succinate-semialdehyde dehydrogenase [Sphingobacteriales bacterium]|nr:MAG: NAD-dependent succinate-semialdehyde dehydrogenase [Sphingobacteriales bacterium]